MMEEKVFNRIGSVLFGVLGVASGVSMFCGAPWQLLTVLMCGGMSVMLWMNR